MKFEFTQTQFNPTNEQKWDQIRNWRQIELNLTDWTQLPDSPANKEVWANYRQALRDLPSQSDDPNEIEIPERPLL